VVRRLAAVRSALKTGEPTVPGTLAEEMQTNPFLRAGDERLKKALGMEGEKELAVFTRLRGLKDRF
jgi:hydroxyacylglutathione hydrolase